MEKTLEKLLKKECLKHIKKHLQRVNTDKKNQKRFSKRTGIPSKTKRISTPKHWKLDKFFNPFYVRKNISFITKTIAVKIRNNTYRPKPSLVLTIPKRGGGERKITIFTIPDAVVSNYLYKLILKRNYSLLSSYAYAYRTDRNAQNAIEHLFINIKNKPRKFVLEYDFSKYFDTINHQYLIKVLKDHFKISTREIFIIEQLLKHRKSDGIDNYESSIFTENQIGIPQGSTISLFLANVACHELDKEIENTGAVFARFSDDSIILSESYDTAHKCANLMISHGNRSGTKINFNKSDGISLLTESNKSEMVHKTSFNFLGHKLSNYHISFKEDTLKRIKQKISRIINYHLILYPKKYNFNPKRYDSTLNVDWDLVTCINEIRRYIYGQVSEEKITNCINTKTEKLKPIVCFMLFYSLINDENIFKSLDGWLCEILYQALKTRKKILVPKYLTTYNVPSKHSLIMGNWYSVSTLRQETKLPNFYKSWLYVQKLVKIYGLQRIPSNYYPSN